MPAIGRLHVLTDTTCQQRRTHAELAQRAVRGGADVVQFRQKDGTVREKLRAAHAAAEACAQADVPLLINDHVDIALAVDAAGVHLGQDDFPIAEARKVLGPGAVIGATATTAAQAQAAEADGASYVGFGPVFPTRSKANPASVKGLEGLSHACRATTLPVIAIAGITPERVSACLKAGAHGVAVLSGIAGADEPEQAARRYRTALQGALPTHAPEAP